MKELVILLENRRTDYSAGRFLKDNLQRVLENSVNIHICFLSDMDNFRFADMDLILVMVPTLLHKINMHIYQRYASNKFLLVTRTLSQEALDKVKRIPYGARVLVKNRTQETTADLIRILYELEIIHLDMVAYEQGIDPNDFDYVITTSKDDFLNDCNSNIVDIGYRLLGAQAFLDIFSRLDIRDPHLHENLEHYIQSLPAKYNDVEKRYQKANMTAQILNKALEKSDFGVLVTDAKRKILYCNRKAEAMLKTKLRQGETMILNDGVGLIERMYGSNFHHEVLNIGRDYIMMERHYLKTGNALVGYFFECRTAKSIHELGSRLSESLKESGLCAQYTFDDISYFSPEMAQCIGIAKKLAVTNYPILLEGESGTGKELFAQSIHNESNRSQGPFIAINCAALPENLLESELFGYEDGAFTGSRKKGKIGLLELASKGSIFLDEIGDMPLPLQAKLLRALQEKKIMRIGGSRVVNIDIRVLSASNKNLKDEIAANNFRSDLYYRLSTFIVELPPLRRRREDILPLFRSFSESGGEELTEKQKAYLLSYRWPGNVRELQNAVAYYDVIGKLPNEGIADKDSERDAEKDRLLELLSENSDDGLGRGRIIELMEQRGTHLSQQRFEELISELLEEKRIIRGRGRQGIHLAK